MFATLLKYEFKHSWKVLLPINGANLLLGCIGFVLMLIMTALFQSQNENIMAFGMLFYLLWAGLLLLLPIFAFASAIILSLRFYRHKFTDQGYLTFTLPATTHQILLSSIANFLIWNLLNAIITVICYVLMVLPFIVWMVKEIGQLGVEWSMLSEVLKILWENYLGDIISISAISIAGYISYLIGSLFYGVMLPYVSIAVGSTLAKRYKLLASVGVGIGIYIVMYVITMLLQTLEYIIHLITLFSMESLSILSSGSITMLIMGILNFAFAIGGYFLTHHLIDKKLNL